MNIQLATIAVFDRDREDFRFEARASTDFAHFAIHKAANAIAREFALGLLVKPLHLRHQPLKRPGGPRSTAIARKNHLDRLIACAEIERMFEGIRQLFERHILHYAKMPNERRLQSSVIGLHSFCPAPPRYDGAFRERFFRIGNHQLHIANELCAESMTRGASAEMTVKRKMFRSELA